MEILNSQQMSLADKLTIEELKTPSIVLMENAARATTDEILKVVDPKSSVAVIVGSGNNGGDGVAIARHLFNKGVYVEIFLTESEERFSNDLRINYEIIKRYPIKIKPIEDFEDRFDVVVDAIFGTGLNRTLEGRYLEIIRMINNLTAKIVAVDIPSGLSGSSPNLLGEAVKADLTITFCRPKIPHCIYPAKEFCGDVRVVDISIPDFIIPKVEPYLFLIEKKSLPKLPKRQRCSHKGNYGHAVLLGGSSGKSGAIIMSTFATIKTGAGLTTTILPEKVSGSLSSYLPEAMYMPIKDYNDLTEEDIKEILKLLRDKTVLTIGPGMGTSSGARTLTKRIIENTDLNLIFDADGINNLVGIDYELLRGRSIITPHIGEFARILSISKEELSTDIINITRTFAIRNGIVVVLKSASTLVALPDGDIYVYPGGVPALAKGGSGDCLVGIITGLVAQGFSLKDASILGVYIFGETGRFLSFANNEMTILATDVIKNIGRVMDDIQSKEC